MNQRMRRASKKGEDSMFVFFTPKQLRIKDLAEIKKHQLKKSKNLSVPVAGTGNTQFSNSNCLKTLKASFLSQVFNTDSKEKISDSKLILGSKSDLDNVNNKNMMATLLATDAENSYKKAQKDKQTSCTNRKN